MKGRAAIRKGILGHETKAPAGIVADCLVVLVMVQVSGRMFGCPEVEK